MKKVLLNKKYISPVTGTLALLICITGIQLFFKIGDSYVKGMHEWLGLLFVALIALHLTINWRIFSSYFRKTSAWVLTAVVLVTGGVFVASAMQTSSENPMKGLIMQVESAPISKVAPLFNTTEQQLIEAFKAAGISVESGDASIRDIAKANQRQSMQLMSMLVNFSE